MSDYSKIQFRCIQSHGVMMQDGTTANQHWIVNGKTFYQYPTDCEIDEAYTVKDELTAARECIRDLAEALKVALMNLDPCDMPDRDFDLIEAAIDKHKAEIDKAQ